MHLKTEQTVLTLNSSLLRSSSKEFIFLSNLSYLSHLCLLKVRWYHGAVVINTKLYAVAGCGQLNTIEVKINFESF